MFDRLVTSVVKNRVLILLLMAVLVGWGLYSWRQVPVDAYPELTNNQVQILTRVPGMSPVEVEKLVTYPIEISMTNLEGVQDNRSLSQFGLSVGRIQDAIDLAIGGERVSTVLEGDRRFALVGKLQEADCNSAASIRSLPLTTPDGTQIRLRDVATVELTEAPAEVAREQGKRKITLGVNVSGRDTGSFVAEARAALQEAVSLPMGYFVEWGGQFENQQRAQRRLMLILPITLAVVFVLLYMTFHSLRQAVLVFLNIPVSVVGGVLLLWGLGLYMSVPASVGFIAVLGIAVQNGVVMVSFIDDLRERGRSLADAVRTGALLRLRPILMTTLTTLLGLLPLLVAEGIGANVQRPLAAVVVGGIFTLVPSTLLLLPVLYGWFNPEPKRKAPIAREIEAGEQAELHGSVAS